MADNQRVLRQYGYPPDMQMLATETVLKQAELNAEELTRGKLNSNVDLVVLKKIVPQFRIGF